MLAKALWTYVRDDWPFGGPDLMTNSRCAYAATDPEAASICALFQSAPELTDPLIKREVPLFNGPVSTPATNRKGVRHA